MSEEPAEQLVKRWVRRGFARNAAGYEGANFLAREVGGRMAERLDLLREPPQAVLDLGSGTGLGARTLRARYPSAMLVELDHALEMLRQSAQALSWWQRGLQRMRSDAPMRTCGDAESLPFRDRSFGMVWSNLTLHWTHLASVFKEVRRVLRPGGVFMFSTLGPDTLKELRASYAQADGFDHVNRFVDLHDIGDLLVEARFADPVMDMELLTLTYDDVGTMLRELRAGGARNANVHRPRGLSGRRGHDRMQAAYERLRKDGRLPATFEVIYGHAWRPDRERASSSGEAIVEFHPRKGRER